MSFRNRMMIAGASGPILLSIPLDAGRNQKSLTKDVVIDRRSSWRSRHWKTIVSCYSRSPWFEFYRDELEGIYKREYELLLEWNLVCLHWSLTKLDIKIPVSLTDDWRRQQEQEVVENWRNKLSPASLRRVAETAPRYKQVFEDRTGFIPNLSVLDLLFCEGKNAGFILGLK